MICPSCTFETSRLLVKEWHSFTANDWVVQELADVVVQLLSEPVTRELPADWQGTYTRERARQWIEDRDREGATLLVVAKSTGEPVGLVILFETAGDASGTIELRLGYLLAEAVWGQGLASELLRGFVDWCKANHITSIAGGVARGNIASRRVLEKNGFVAAAQADGVESEEQLFRLQIES